MLVSVSVRLKPKEKLNNKCSNKNARHSTLPGRKLWPDSISANFVELVQKVYISRAGLGAINHAIDHGIYNFVTMVVSWTVIVFNKIFSWLFTAQ